MVLNEEKANDYFIAGMIKLLESMKELRVIYDGCVSKKQKLLKLRSDYTGIRKLTNKDKLKEIDNAIAKCNEGIIDNDMNTLDVDYLIEQRKRDMLNPKILDKVINVEEENDIDK